MLKKCVLTTLFFSLVHSQSAYCLPASAHGKATDAINTSNTTTNVTNTSAKVAPATKAHASKVKIMKYNLDLPQNELSARVKPSKPATAHHRKHSEDSLLPEALKNGRSVHRYRFLMGFSLHNDSVADDLRLIGETATPPSFTPKAEPASPDVIGHSSRIETHHNLGFGLMMGIEFYDSLALTLNYERWHRHDQTSNAFKFPEHIVVHPPFIASDRFATRQFGQMSYHYDTASLLFSQSLPPISAFVSQILVGGKWLKLDAKRALLLDNFIEPGINPNLGLYTEGSFQSIEHSKFNGIGPAVGLQGRVPFLMKDNPIGIFGSVLFSMLFDDIDAHSTVIFDDGDTILTITEDDDIDNRQVFNATIRLGFDYLLPLNEDDMLQFAIGYQFDYYENIFRSPSQLDHDSWFSKKGIFAEIVMAV